MSAISDRRDANDAYAFAARKAARSHKTWIVWSTTQGTWRAAAVTVASLTAAHGEGRADAYGAIVVAVEGDGTRATWKRSVVEAKLREPTVDEELERDGI